MNKLIYLLWPRRPMEPAQRRTTLLEACAPKLLESGARYLSMNIDDDFATTPSPTPTTRFTDPFVAEVNVWVDDMKVRKDLESVLLDAEEGHEDEDREARQCRLERRPQPEGSPVGQIGDHLVANKMRIYDWDGRLTEHNAASIIAERGAGKRVAMIGHFPFAERLAPVCGELWVFERGDGRREGDFADDMVDELLPQAEVVAVTSTTIINRTLPGLLGLVRPDAFVLLLGPSTPLTPRLFDHGIDLLCGTLIVDPAAVLRAVEQGAVTSQIRGVRRVCLWPD